MTDLAPFEPSDLDALADDISEGTLDDAAAERDDHGTMACHRAGCRCDACREAVNAYKREWRAKRRGHEGIRPGPKLPWTERLPRLYKVDENGCWIWQGAVRAGGYGHIGIDGRRVAAHRASWELYRGPIPEGLQIDHLCRVRNCVNPDHLEPVTQAENVRRGMSPTAVAAREKRCFKGHSMEDPWIGGDGKRRCRICLAERLAAQRAARKERRR